jgi:acyl carrier protein
MTEAELRKTVLDALGDIAPEADLATLAPGKDFREELDIDSMDFLNFVIALREAWHRHPRSRVSSAGHPRRRRRIPLC